MAHEDSKSRLARLDEGMRYERGGKAKYWLPRPGEVNATSPLLGGPSSSRAGDTLYEQMHGTFDDPQLDEEEERMYNSARQLEYGDWNVGTCVQFASRRNLTRFSIPSSLRANHWPSDIGHQSAATTANHLPCQPVQRPRRSRKEHRVQTPLGPLQHSRRVIQHPLSSSRRRRRQGR